MFVCVCVYMYVCFYVAEHRNLTDVLYYDIEIISPPPSSSLSLSLSLSLTHTHTLSHTHTHTQFFLFHLKLAFIGRTVDKILVSFVGD